MTAAETARRLEIIRAHLGLEKQELAALLGYSPGHVTSWLSGIRTTAPLAAKAAEVGQHLAEDWASDPGRIAAATEAVYQNVPAYHGALEDMDLEDLVRLMLHAVAEHDFAIKPPPRLRDP